MLLLLLPLVLASNEQDDVEERPEEEAPRHGHQQALPFPNIRDGLRRQHVGAGGDAGGCRHVGPQRPADGLQHLELDALRHVPDRRSVEHLHAAREAARRVAELVLQHRLVRVLHQRQVVEPNPVVRDPVAVDEEAGEEEEVGEDGDDHRVAQHDVRHHRREERDEAAARPEGCQDDEHEEEERRRAAGQPHRPERGDRERQRQEHQRRERDHGVGKHVRDAAVRVVRRLAQVDVPLLHEHRERVGAHVEHGGHAHGEEP